MFARASDAAGACAGIAKWLASFTLAAASANTSSSTALKSGACAVSLHATTAGLCRVATAQATEHHTTLLRISKEDYQRIFADFHVRQREEKRGNLSRCPLFRPYVDVRSLRTALTEPAPSAHA